MVGDLFQMQAKPEDPIVYPMPTDESWPEGDAGEAMRSGPQAAR